MEDYVESIPEDVDIRLGVRIPMRDGIHLNATVYEPAARVEPAPVIFTMTPYIGQTYHDQAMYFASRGYPFLTVDVRGRGDSEGVFRPIGHEPKDGHDIVEWIARQPRCNGKVAMWGGSYGGYTQWATVKELPPHLASIVPVAAPFRGVDSPLRGNVFMPYSMRWLTYLSGRASQEKVFADLTFWHAKFRQWFQSGIALREFDELLGNPSEIFREWLEHPHRDAYWDRGNPSAEEYARLSIPVLTITGMYDGNQPGALEHYRQHLNAASAGARARHYLVIGPWDHAGTRTPQAEFAGVEVGPASLVDLRKLHLDWYAWTMQGGPRPAFLKSNVAYYVTGAEQWRYAETLDGVTARMVPFYLHSQANPLDVFRSGTLMEHPHSGSSGPDHYVYDPRDVSLAELESTIDPDNRADQRMLHARAGRHLVYHSAPFEQDVEVSGFFKLCAWLAIDQPDTDFLVSVYDVADDGTALQLTTDWLRARYRESSRAARLIETTAPLRYDFERFLFVSRQLRKGHRLRLVIGPIDSIFVEKNYNSGGVVASESVQDARTVTVKLYHDTAHPSALYVPFGQPGGSRIV